MIDGMTEELWWIAIVLAVVVTLVVAVLLRLIITTASDIEGAVSQIWIVGQKTANNTIHIASLYKTNELVEGIVGRAKRILTNAGAIVGHAESCPGCPACMLGRKS
jgi:hypothetical protein